MCRDGRACCSPQAAALQTLIGLAQQSVQQQEARTKALLLKAGGTGGTGGTSGGKAPPRTARLEVARAFRRRQERVWQSTARLAQDAHAHATQLLRLPQGEDDGLVDYFA